MALADINASNATGVANLLDVTGYNHLEQFYERDHQAHPNRHLWQREQPQSRRLACRCGQRLGCRTVPLTGMISSAKRAVPTHGSSSGLLDLEGFWKPASAPGP